MALNQYETIFIMTPILSQEEVKKQIKKYKDFLSSDGSTIVADEHWGLKQLAYPINNMTTGIYHLIHHESDGSKLAEMNVMFQRDEGVLRELTVKQDKYSNDFNDRRRKGEAGPNRKNKAVETTTDSENQE